MGKILEKKKKKKGRPSLLDLQKRNLKLQQQQQQHIHNPPIKNKTPNLISNPNPNLGLSTRRSTRRNPNPNSDTNGDDNDVDDDDDDDDNGDDDLVGCSISSKKEKRINLFLNSDNSNNNGDVSSGLKPDPDDVGPNKRKRKIDSISSGSGFDSSTKDENNSALAKRANTQQGSKLDDGPSSTPLPDNKLLLFILDRLKKKDTYGVFSEPVDPEELPDYLEVVQNPMDFSTVRKKVLDSAYANLEEFEKDVLLICSNAMLYNAPDTVYFRQARSIQELAKKDFENLRHESDDDNEPQSGPKVARRGRPPLKNLFKRPPGRPPLERPNSTSHEPTPSTTVEITNRSNNDVSKGSPVTPVTEKRAPANSLAQSLYGSRNSEACNGSSTERYEKSEDMIVSASKWSLGKNWIKNNNVVFDETRRNTYKQTCASACRQEMSVLTTFHGERKLLIPVGFHTEYGYARSLSRFAAKLGPIAWKVASRKIEKSLPSGVKFGPGWVAEYEGPSQLKLPFSLSRSGDRSSNLTQGSDDKLVPKTEEISSNRSKLDDGSANVPVPSSVLNNGAGSKLNSNVLYQTQQSCQNKCRVNGLNGGYGVIGPTRSPSGSNLQSNPCPSLSRTETQNVDPPSGDSNDCGGEANISDKPNAVKSKSSDSEKVSCGPPDLNVGFVAQGSPGASGRTDGLHPDLALQL